MTNEVDNIIKVSKKVEKVINQDNVGQIIE